MLQIETRVPLKNKTFYGIGGPADEFIEVSDPKFLPEIWAETVSEQRAKIVMGKGSNIVFSDRGFRGRVFLPTFESVSFFEKGNNTFVTAEAGRNFQSLVEQVAKCGFEDFANLSGIPGNVGGFVRGNAGAYGSETADNIVAVEFLDETGALQKWSKAKCDFEYRGSIFKQNPDLFILQATWQLSQKQDPSKALQKAKSLLSERWAKYPPGRSGGCVFKNPEGDFAGKILEELGAKSDQMGGITIAEEHANFFVNKGKGTQQEIIELIQKWQKKVEEERGIYLEPEIFLVDERGQKI